MSRNYLAIAGLNANDKGLGDLWFDRELFINQISMVSVAYCFYTDSTLYHVEYLSKLTSR